MLEQAPAFHHLDNAAAHQLGGIASLNPLTRKLDVALGHLPPFGVQQVRDRLEGGGLAGAVSPE